ncbi:hypothetical protein Clacol_009714 [Clathrus columnatus]|uniref:Major facilitator superfamily (MFS) profile domain-containing protein n=1 Tax=Clathrus columnatus TaxID=1419009 RepID=A0AAV5ALA7_9AGAM|nr:hypothetical protein Clacol_009714 [Clathrus columnatus]
MICINTLLYTLAKKGWYAFEITAQIPPNDSFAERHMATNDERSPLLKSSNDNEGENQQISFVNSLPLIGPKITSNKELKGPLEISTSNKRVIVIITWFGVLLGTLNNTLGATLITSISSEFHASNQASWLGTSYLLATCTFSPLYGHLSDILGRRGANQTAIVFAGVGTLLCGLSPNFLTLIVSRFITGIGGGGVLMLAAIVTADMFSARERGLVLGISQVFTGIGTGFGGPIGGFFNDRFGWRWAFLVQLPFFVIAFVLTTYNLRYVTPGTSRNMKDILKRTVLLTSASEAAKRRDWKVPQGLGFGIMLHIGLVALPASVDRKYHSSFLLIPYEIMYSLDSAMAVAAGFAQIWRNVGQVWGVAIASAIFQSILARELKTRIIGPGSEEIPEISLNDSHPSRTNPNDQSGNTGRPPPQDIEN